MKSYQFTYKISDGRVRTATVDGGDSMTVSDATRYFNNARLAPWACVIKIEDVSVKPFKGKPASFAKSLGLRLTPAFRRANSDSSIPA